MKKIAIMMCSLALAAALPMSAAFAVDTQAEGTESPTQEDVKGNVAIDAGPDMTLAVGESKAQAATVTQDGKDVTADYTITYTSANEAIATVAADGTVTAVAAGNTTITATAEAAGVATQAEEGALSDSYTVTVTEDKAADNKAADKDKAKDKGTAPAKADDKKSPKTGSEIPAAALGTIACLAVAGASASVLRKKLQ
ncbi:Ig-like domain-containing protein [Slackia heliotrinireducens]|uniref:Ig-like domain-containing protein n=1 Tax=Slackia heliotrinireducens (strain ATCC 29202 / DSM 20476 / NCTC 11029 / RHS 1) TaxID=471855 RepID=C7N5W5_SLAHD|nr:Ig-like domain-containing protein [Slackia heliotrinireducens]ACV22300.1 Ig-like domain-containing protein [Slackia heliotrinireducens DSM 20476]VEH00504.1 Bacterial Ig-like domain (group 2) [Slackia heliotrinireducens]